MIVHAYLSFNGQCEEALNFYKTALDAKVVALMHFGDRPKPAAGQDCAPPEGCPPVLADDKVMHASFQVGETLIHANDCRSPQQTGFQSFGLALTANSIADAERRFANLSAGGHVIMPMQKTFFSPKFGVVADKFGVAWMVLAPQ